MEVYLIGEQNRTKHTVKDDSKSVIKIRNIIIHEDFNLDDIHDIALLKTKTAIKFTNEIVPICISANISHIKDGVIVGLDMNTTNSDSKPKLSINKISENSISFSQLCKLNSFCVVLDNSKNESANENYVFYVMNNGKYYLKGIEATRASTVYHSSKKHQNFTVFVDVLKYIDEFLLPVS